MIMYLQVPNKLTLNTWTYYLRSTGIWRAHPKLNFPYFLISPNKYHFASDTYIAGGVTYKVQHFGEEWNSWQLAGNQLKRERIHLLSVLKDDYICIWRASLLPLHSCSLLLRNMCIQLHQAMGENPRTQVFDFVGGVLSSDVSRLHFGKLKFVAWCLLLCQFPSLKVLGLSFDSNQPNPCYMYKHCLPEPQNSRGRRVTSGGHPSM